MKHELALLKITASASNSGSFKRVWDGQYIGISFVEISNMFVTHDNLFPKKNRI